MKQSQFLSVLTASVLLTGLLSGHAALAQTKAAGKAQVVNSIVVVVNDEVITRQELNERLLSVERRLKTAGTAAPERADLQKQILERMILDRAQLQLAKENGIRVDDVMLDRTMLRMAEQNKMSLQEFRNQIEREGTPYPRFREEIRDDILMQRVREREVDSKILITESEVDNFLAAEASAKVDKQEINLAHILVRIPENATAEQITLRRARAEEVLQKLRSGGDFAKLAVTYSDSAEALKGGDLGWREQERLPQLFVDAISKIKEGEFSEIVRSPNGFHIVKLNGKRASSDTKADAAVVQQTHVRHILMKANQIVNDAEVRQKMLDLKQKIDSKAATFEDLAKANSSDGSASKGGDLGWIYPGDTVPEFEQAMNKLAINEVSAPVQSQFGYHLIQVLERKSEDQSKDRKRLAARQALHDRKADEALQDWLRELRDRTYVEFRLDDK
ncbi:MULTISPECIES: peptidylprolyl isomerase [unclassified Undibacterium]|uniref:peptidylprolyl isomerase n=1 Tax=unclassified Undibacterium TaxID=2630295 RepID=UPI002AC93344|nr:MULTISPECIES: peptidylprolyl isomerase [unclassified Undibacterium]MEB0139256.1 peptidylprolyl isomerase [Undibacterium sp. CCC2.1]MEB0172100.1 peptidylprolyl isomerase [Undibacterium sp. CCC1.1]MEB0175975.1 peptidylprolyl isomerase [Undibacterium sp. CCC3.4]MEB0215287.1 peptidylprolyl isomerase [Undibacterium sp. 5I2]WPX45461.1 peptidylprolyl isomerase [Undibacterium sp. CCC3.4]